MCVPRPSDGRDNQEDGDVSKRPKSANAVMSRLRRPAGRLRDLPIWSKLGLIMLVPTLATIIVGTTGLVGHIKEASDAERARNLVKELAAARSRRQSGRGDDIRDPVGLPPEVHQEVGDAVAGALIPVLSRIAALRRADVPA